MRNLEFDAAAFEDFAWWVERDPFHGIGQPERVKHDLTGCWSRRIDDEHRLVYEVFEDKIRILACRYYGAAASAFRPFSLRSSSGLPDSPAPCTSW